MSESIYEKIENRISTLNNIIFGFSVNGKDVVYTLDDYVQFCGGIVVSNESQSYIIEFDQFIRENQDPAKYEKYLNTFLEKYVVLDSQFDKLLSWQINYVVISDITLKSRCIKQIIEHLKGLLNPENEIQATPQKFEKLLPIEKILIVYYLNQNNKLFNNPLNQLSLKSGKYFLSRLLDINPDSIKNPVKNISDYTINKVTEKQAESFYKTLEKVKSFFDNSELNEISKVIETRINELKRISGKD